MNVTSAFTEVLGTGTSFWLLLAALLGAVWLAPRASILRRYSALTLLVLSLARVHPPATLTILETILPTFQPWRLLFWPLPLAALAAGGVLSLLSLASNGPFRRTATGATLLLLVAAATIGPTSTLREANQVRLTGPGLKVPPEDFALAQEISAATAGRAVVLAPDAIATWIPVTRNHDYPYLNRLFWAYRLGPRLGWRESLKRRKLMEYVGGEQHYRMAPGALAQILQDGEIEVVVFHRGHDWTDEIRGVAASAGGSRILMNYRYEVWADFNGTASAPATGSPATRKPPQSVAEPLPHSRAN